MSGGIFAGVSGEDTPVVRTLREQTEAFLADFFAKGEELVRDLIQENERLRGEADDDDGKGAPGLSLPPPPAAAMIQRLVDKVEELEAECVEIRRLAGSMEQESGNYRTRLDDLENEHYHLAAMYVAGNQFHTSATIDDVLQTITEILLNFVGVGKFTVFGIDEARQCAFPLMREGGELSECSEFPLSEAGGDGAEPKGPWRSRDPLAPSEGVLTSLPLVAGTRLVGVARVESFLPQKSDFADTDFGLLELVSEHAGVGIETAWIRAHAREVPMQRAAVENLVTG